MPVLKGIRQRMLKIADIARGGLSRIILIVGVMLLMAGCSQIIIPNTPDGTILSPSNSIQVAETQVIPTSASQGDAQMTPSLPAPGDAGLQSLIETAKEDLAQRLSLSVTQINLIEAKALTWPDSSLGCPQPGMAYTQILTPGYLILLEADRKVYEYHANRDTYVIFCKNPSPPVPGMPGDI
jgi:hypothetical protein